MQARGTLRETGTFCKAFHGGTSALHDLLENAHKTVPHESHPIFEEAKIVERPTEEAPEVLCLFEEYEAV